MTTAWKLRLYQRLALILILDKVRKCRDVYCITW
jgi:hypothetical protein